MKNFIMMVVGLIDVIFAYIATLEMMTDLNFRYLDGNFWAQVVTTLIISVVFDAFVAWVYQN